MKKLAFYYNSLSILKKFLIPSIAGFMFFLLFYIYILSNTNYMKESISKINKESIPLYETLFDNEFLLQKISFELNNAVVVKELDLIKETNIYAKEMQKKLTLHKDTIYKKELDNIQKSFNEYYFEASNLSKDLIESTSSYDYIHFKTLLVVSTYKKVLNQYQNLRDKIKNEIKQDVNSIYQTSSWVLFNSSFAFILWIILSSLGLFFIYKDMSFKISQIVEESENIAHGKVNFHKRLSSDSIDELGLIVNSINTFISKLEESHKDLEYAKEEIKRFIADTVHQIRTPFTSILMNLEMIKDLQENDSWYPLT